MLKPNKGLSMCNIMFKEKNIYDVGIISFNINTNLSNYGAALHSYAFQKFLNKNNIKSVIIDYQRSSLAELLCLAIRHKPIKNLPFIISCMYKNHIFRRFFKKYCTITRKRYNKTSANKINCANKYCCETDVTWAAFKGGYDRAFMCDYPNMRNKDNIAYSVDFGSKIISEEKKALLKRYSKNFKHISIRNTFRLEEFKSIVERDDIVNTLDSVFLLDKSDYDSIIDIPNNKKDYVFVYNCKENHKGMIKSAKEFAAANNLDIKIVNCYDRDGKNKVYAFPTPLSIEKFLGYMKKAKYVFTNSYHGVCFSIIFEKEFFAFARNGNSQKIKTVLSSFNLDNRYVENKNFDLDKIDYCKINKTIQGKKKESQLWLIKAIKF